MQIHVWNTRSVKLLAAAVGMTLAGCGVLPDHPPQTAEELRLYRESSSQEYTPRMIALHNARRVSDEGVPVEDRIESMRVVRLVNVAADGVYPALRSVLASRDAPASLKRDVLALLAEKDRLVPVEQGADALAAVEDARLRSSLQEWLGEHPSQTPMDAVVKLWSADTAIDQIGEARYRRAVERISGMNWPEALLSALNTKSFSSRGSAIEILASRLDHDSLRRAILDMPGRTYVVRTLKDFSDRFGYLPGTRRELLAAVTLRNANRGRLDGAQRIADLWRSQYDNRFNIRDFHLLSGLSADPLRMRKSRAQLILEITGGITSRRQGRGNAGKRLFRRGRLVDFDAQAESLTMADLWNIFLLGEMLDKPRVLMALKVTVQRDRQDRLSQWGGLISYDQGNAEARLYRPGARRADDRFIPGKRMLNDAFDCLCYFVGHFSRDVENTSRIGPGEKELAFAGKYNVCGVVFTSLAGDRLNATYFTPDGIVVDMGDFPLGRSGR